MRLLYGPQDDRMLRLSTDGCVSPSRTGQTCRQTHLTSNRSLDQTLDLTCGRKFILLAHISFKYIEHISYDVSVLPGTFWLRMGL